MARCTHLGSVEVTELPESVDGCEDCLREGGAWLHLRICLTCGHVGCCDDSPARHATAHAASSGHPLIRSLEPGEDWAWCYLDELAMVIPDIHGQTRIPPSPLASLDVRDVPERSRYELSLDGSVVGFVDYRRHGDLLTLAHTEIDERRSGAGLGSRLVEDVLADARRRGLEILPACPFIQSYISRHDEYADLVPAAQRERFGLRSPGASD